MVQNIKYLVDLYFFDIDYPLNHIPPSYIGLSKEEFCWEGETD